VAIWYIIWNTYFGILRKEKPGNPGCTVAQEGDQTRQNSEESRLAKNAGGDKAHF
jgi:hypothetical protein